jgi:hypothetical protein
MKAGSLRKQALLAPAAWQTSGAAKAGMLLAMVVLGGFVVTLAMLAYPRTGRALRATATVAKSRTATGAPASSAFGSARAQDLKRPSLRSCLGKIGEAHLDTSAHACKAHQHIMP